MEKNETNTAETAVLPDCNRTTTWEISIAQGAEWTYNWQNQHPNDKKAFLVCKSEIDTIFRNNPTANYIRFYLGIDTSGRTPEQKMIMVPVNAAEADVIPNPAQPSQSNIFDFTTPCPPTCTTSSSPLCVACAAPPPVTEEIEIGE